MLLGVVAMLIATGAARAGQTYYVAPDGNDRWSGTLPAPNAARSDGPFASIAQARDAIRQWKAGHQGLAEPVRVQIRGGTYYLAETITFGPEDSGTPQCPIVYEAFPGEQPVLVGGQKITGWQPCGDKIRCVSLPEVQAGQWNFRSFFVDGRRQIRARAPNVDASDPYRKGFFYVDTDPEAFGLVVGNIHNPGDWTEYKVQAPSDGEYAVWIYYGAFNAPFGRKDMGGRTALTVDEKQTVPLLNMPDTGAWDAFRWSQAASVRLSRGEHLLKWQNLKGGGLSLASFALADDPAWRPVGTELAQPAAGRHVLVIQAAAFAKFHGKQLSVAGSNLKGLATRFRYAPHTFKPAWALAPDAEVHIFQSGSCRAYKEIVSIAKVDEKACTVMVCGKECSAALLPGDRYFIENVAEELDSPGEWYLDRRNGKLLYWPTAGFSDKSEAIAPRLGRLVQFLGDAKAGKAVSWIRLSGLTFRETDYSPDDGCPGYGMGAEGVVHLQNATGCAVADCVFRNIGKYAVCVTGGSRNTIDGNDISEGAEGGVLLLRTVGNTVSDNHVHHCGAVYKHIGGVVLEGAGTDENVIAHNAIHDVSRYGISLKNVGSHNRIEQNRVLNTSLETCDTGGIEVTQGDRNFRSGSIIRNNVVGDTIGYSANGPKSTFMSWGIYLDSFAGGYTVTHNICYRSAHGGLMLQGGKDNRVENNIFVDGKLNQMHLSNFADNSTGQVFRRNIVCYSDPKAVFISGGKLDPQVIEIDHNLYFHAGKDLVIRARGVTSWADWQKRGFDRNSRIADPRFVDAAHDDFALKADSPAWALGFEPIDISRVGPLKKRCQCSIRPAAADFGLSSDSSTAEKE